MLQVKRRYNFDEWELIAEYDGEQFSGDEDFLEHFAWLEGTDEDAIMEELDGPNLIAVQPEATEKSRRLAKPEAVHDCVQSILEDDPDMTEDEAWAICQDQHGGKAKEREYVDSVHDAPDDATVHVELPDDEDGDKRLYIEKEWVEDPTEQAPNRWTNTETGEHRYQEEKPGGGEGEETDEAVSPERANLTLDEFDFEDIQVGDVIYTDVGYDESTGQVAGIEEMRDGTPRLQLVDPETGESEGGITPGALETVETAILNPDDVVDVADGEEEQDEEADEGDAPEPDEVDMGEGDDFWSDVSTEEELEDAIQERSGSPFIKAELDGLSESQVDNWTRALGSLDGSGFFDDVDPKITTEGTPDGDEFGYYDADQNELFLDPDKNYDDRIVTDYEDGYLSSMDPSHTLHHEAAHALHYNRLGSTDQRILSNREPDQEIAGEVSELAKASAMEFVSEVFAGVMGGETFSEAVKEEYEKHDGPELPEEVTWE